MALNPGLEAEPPSYADQLYQVFTSCDECGSGLLDKDGVADLCDKLQLDDDQTFFMLDHLIGDDLIAQVIMAIFVHARTFNIILFDAD